MTFGILVFRGGESIILKLVVDVAQIEKNSGKLNNWETVSMSQVNLRPLIIYLNTV